MNTNHMNPAEIWNMITETSHELLLGAMADAVSETRTACEMDAQLTDQGRLGLLRLMEIAFDVPIPHCIAGADFCTMGVLADILPLVYVHVIFAPVINTGSMVLYGELLRMMQELMKGEWFE